MKVAHTALITSSPKRKIEASPPTTHKPSPSAAKTNSPKTRNQPKPANQNKKTNIEDQNPETTPRRASRRREEERRIEERSRNGQSLMFALSKLKPHASQPTLKPDQTNLSLGSQTLLEKSTNYQSKEDISTSTRKSAETSKHTIWKESLKTTPTKPTQNCWREQSFFKSCEMHQPTTSSLTASGPVKQQKQLWLARGKHTEILGTNENSEATENSRNIFGMPSNWVK